MGAFYGPCFVVGFFWTQNSFHLCEKPDANTSPPTLHAPVVSVHSRAHSGIPAEPLPCDNFYLASSRRTRVRVSPQPERTQQSTWVGPAAESSFLPWQETQTKAVTEAAVGPQKWKPLTC